MNIYVIDLCSFVLCADFHSLVAACVLYVCTVHMQGMYGNVNEIIYGILNGDKVAQKWCLREIRSFSNCDVDKLVSDLKVAPWSVMETLDDVDDLWEFWKKLFTKVLDSHVPLKRFRIRRKMLPWVSPEIRLLMKQRVFQLKRAKRTKQTED